MGDKRGLIKLTRWVAILFAAVAFCAHAEVELPTGYYHTTVVDLRVKVLGGEARAERTWYQGRWHFNRTWNPLMVEYDIYSGGIKGIVRNQGTFRSLTTVSSGTGGGGGTGKAIFVLDRRKQIVQEDEGFRWEDPEGNWIEYDDEGLPLKYGDRNKVSVTIAYDSLGRRKGAFDHLGRQVLWYDYDDEGRLRGVRDNSYPTPRRVAYGYSDGRLTSVTDVRGKVWRYDYDAGELVSITDPDGRVTTLTYHNPELKNEPIGPLRMKTTDGGGGGYATVRLPRENSLRPASRVKSIAYPDGAVISYDYDYDKTKKQYYVRINNPNGGTSEIWYNSDGQPVRTDLGGQTLETVAYSSDGRRRVYTDRFGHELVKTYDEKENLTSITYPDTAKRTYTYDAAFSNVLRSVDELGTVAEYEYDERGNLLRRIEAKGTADERITTYTYDEYGNRLTETTLPDANTASATTTYTYDDKGNLTSETDPKGGVTNYTRDIMGNALTKTDPRGHVWTYTYDNAGNLLTEADPLGHTRTFVYDGAGNRVQETAADQSVTKYEYDARGNLTKVTDHEGNSRSYEYNGLDEVTRAVDEAGREWIYQYDQFGRLITTRDGVGNQAARSYGSATTGETGGFFSPAEITYPTYTRKVQYDSRNRVVMDTAILNGADGLVHRYGYDAASNVISETDPEGKTGYYSYNRFGQPTRYTNILGYTLELSYDDRGNVLSIKDENDNVTRYTYDLNNNTTSEIRPSGDAISFRHDATGNLIEVIEPSGDRREYGYDDANRQIAARYYAASAPNTPIQTISYSYDEADRLIAWDDGRVSASIEYDKLGRETKQSINYGAFQLSYRYSYYPNGLKRSFTGPDGITYTYIYDAGNRLTAVQIPGQGSITVNGFKWDAPTAITLPGGTRKEYEYTGLLELQSLQVKDPASNVLAHLELGYDRMRNVTSKDTSQGSYSYAFDEMERLVEQSHTSQGTVKYSFDPAHNRLGDDGTWTYNSNNQLLTRGEYSYRYGPDGDLTAVLQGDQVVRRYYYDVVSRLVRAEDGAGKVLAEYGYGPFDRRLWKDVDGIRTYYLYSKEGLIGEFSATGIQQKAYGYLPDSEWTTNPLFLKTSAGYAYYHNDHIGTPQTITAANGNVVWAAVYEGFGEAQVAPSATIENNLRFAGQYYDAETGLHYNWRRYYDPKTGRYVTMDPIGLDGGVNLYAYVEGNPIMRIDPTGECGLAGIAGGMATSAAIAAVTGTCFEYGWTDALLDGLCLGLLSKLNKLKKLEKLRPLADCNSFPGDTLVHTEDGLVPIEDIKPGMKVKAYAEWTGEDSYEVVTDVITGERIYDLVRITLSSGETIEATDGHPLFVYEHGWRDAVLLNSGERLYVPNAGWVTIESVHVGRRNERVYNLSVANNHTFYVGKQGILAHNAKCPLPANRMQREVERGRAPRDVERVDKAEESVPGSKDHVHFKDGTSMNNDGTIHDRHKGTPKPPKKTREWLESKGWSGKPKE